MVVIGAIAARRWWQMGPLPTGLDGGQWLALGRGLFGEGRSTAGAYPPLTPFLTAVIGSITSPTAALKLIAIGSLLTVLVAVYLLARDGFGPWLGLAVVATIGPASALTEPVAFGGYPQQLAFACLLLATWGLARYLPSGRTGWLVLAGGGLAGAALSHHIYFPLALGLAGLVWLLWLLSCTPTEPILHRTAGAIAAIAVGLACFAPTAVAFLTARYLPPLDATGQNLRSAFAYGAREAVWVWVAITLAGVTSLALTATSRHRDPAWQVAVALTAGAGPLFAFTGETRLLPPFLTGAALGLGFGWQWLRDRLSRSRFAPLPLLAAFVLPAALWIPADTTAAGYFAYYRVLDTPMLGAAAAISAADPDGLVVVRRDWRNWPVGWWFEGLTTAPIAVGSDPRWLGFPAERARAELADRFFAQRLDHDQLRSLAAGTGVELLALRKWEWIGWQRWLEGPTPAVEIVYDDNDFLVLRIVD
jgi:hypothetical protein